MTTNTHMYETHSASEWTYSEKLNARKQDGRRMGQTNTRFLAAVGDYDVVQCEALTNSDL